MGFWLLPVIIFAFLAGIIGIDRNHAQNTLPPAQVTQAAQAGQMFVSYRDAVAVYQRNNPAFIGTVSNADLAALGYQFSSGFLAGAGNAITATGASGRVITCFAALPPGSLQVAYNATEFDASFGVVSGNSWTSKAPGGTAVALATVVPDGDVVSVIQIGN
ncbi:MAG: type IV pilus biogenesis protein PilM [Rhodoferax sp.]|jgi:hypothetical protein|nr:type IV pilus biogenesis protein PilM [Rhodoferax sp.]